MDKQDRLSRYRNIKTTVPGVRLNNIVPTTFLDRLGFFEAPASTKYHGNYEGGLFDHSLAVMESLVDMTKRLSLKWQRPESPYIVGMFHDLCKCDNYIYDIETAKYIYNKDQMLPGHGDKSILILQDYIRLTEEEILCIRYHMGAYEMDKWDYFDRAIKKYHNVLYTHTADMIASKIVGI